MSYPPPNSGHWTTGLCGCFEHRTSCCIGCWCPFILFGQTAEIIDSGRTTSATAGTLFCLVEYLTGCILCFYTYGYRKRFRARFGLPETPCGDCLVDCCCLNCSICQIYREFLNRKIDPSLGYEAAREIWEQPAAPAEQFMTQ